MAKDSGDKTKKKKKAVKAAVGGVKIKVKATRKANAKSKDGAKGKSGAKGKKGDRSPHSGFDALARLADHPMIADLIAVGATAAVAAVAERGRSTSSHSGNAVKAAGKAAAAAIGRRLMTEYNAVKDAAGAAAKKKG